MIHHVFACRENVGDWISARGIQYLLQDVPIRELYCDSPHAEETLAQLTNAKPDDLIVIGGGGLFMDYFTPFWSEFARLAPRVNYCIWGAGGCSHKAGETMIGQALAREMAAMSSLCIARDRMTAEYLGVAAPPVPCPSFALPALATAAGGHALLNVVHTGLLTGKRIDAVRRSCQSFARRASLDYLETSNVMKEASEQQLEQILQLYSQAAVVVSSRLHGCILAVALGTKLVAVSADDKIDAFMRAAGLADWICDPHSPSQLEEKLVRISGQQHPTDFVAQARRQNQAIAMQVRKIANLRAGRAASIGPSAVTSPQNGPARPNRPGCNASRRRKERALPIPKTFHWIWLGDRPLPEEQRRWMDGWLNIHPGWEGLLWTDKNMPVLRNRECYSASTSMAQRADIARYEIILQHGGIYIDTDFECLRNLEPLLEGVEAFIGEEDPARVAIGIFGACPGHAWLRDAVEALPEAYRSEQQIRHQTGPDFIQSVMSRWPEVRRIPPDLFYPYSWREPHRRNEIFPHAYAVHHWAHGWAEEGRAQREKMQVPLRRELEAVIRPGTAFLLVSEDVSVSLADDRYPIPFVSLPPLDWGNPASDGEAIEALQAARRKGISQIAFDAHAGWWLDYYARFHGHLLAESLEVFRGDRVVVFSLKKIAGGNGAAGR